MLGFWKSFPLFDFYSLNLRAQGSSRVLTDFFSRTSSCLREIFVLLKKNKCSSPCVQHRLLQIVRSATGGDERERLRLEFLRERLQLEQVVDERGVVLLRFRGTPVGRIDLWVCMGTNVPLPVEVVVRAHTVDECDALSVVAHEALLEAKWNLEDRLVVPAVMPSVVHLHGQHDNLPHPLALLNQCTRPIRPPIPRIVRAHELDGPNMGYGHASELLSF